MDAPEALHRSSLSPLLAGTPLPEPITPEVTLADNLPAQPSTGEPASAEVEHVISSLKTAEAEARHLLSEIEADGTGKAVVEDVKTFGEFWLKFLNDWIPHFACGLAYSLLMAMVPLVVALAATLGFVQGELDHSAQQAFITYLSGLFPAVLGPDILKPALVLLDKNAGWLGFGAIALAFYNGSRLFATMENYFALIYHTPVRSFWRQNVMALVMLLIFLLLVPIMLFASSIGLGGFLGGIIASLILFQAIYMIVPNRKISWRKSWRGTLVAVVALQIYACLFPLYIQHFMGNYTGNTGFAIILLLFFYYFALILLIGAEVNAFFAEGVRARPRNIAEMIHLATLIADKQALLQLARERMEREAARP
jgi:membrane protein